MSLIKFIELNQRGDERGYLTVIEAQNNIPFNIKRVYFLTSLSPDLPRGFHAHKELEQLAVCLVGSCKVMLDNGKVKEWVTLDSPSKALRIEPRIWHEMHDFSKDCVFLVVASDFYDETDYIRDYQLFLEQAKQ
ncbi:sugar 3,4-ketoisomerase [Alishewanella sp. HL-SH05]|uniref:sugar 3,4-ketoisomerase n=1 Tax=Alishewanella sp. HL-SH05 TaxID=3461145 RepID=UPI004040F8B0